MNKLTILMKRESGSGGNEWGSNLFQSFSTMPSVSFHPLAVVELNYCSLNSWMIEGSHCDNNTIREGDDQKNNIIKKSNKIGKGRNPDDGKAQFESFAFIAIERG